MNDVINEENRGIAAEIVTQKIYINEKITEASDNKELFYLIIAFSIKILAIIVAKLFMETKNHKRNTNRKNEELP